VKSDKETVTGK